MSEYKVMWEIEVEAESPRAAAEQVRQMQLDPESTATVFVVTDPDGNKTQIDLDPVDLFGSPS